MTDTAIISGVGPEQGMGAQLAHRFARLGLQVFVAGRTAASLDAVVAAIARDGGTATAVVADATNEQATTDLFKQARRARWTRNNCASCTFAYARWSRTRRLDQVLRQEKRR